MSNTSLTECFDLMLENGRNDSEALQQVFNLVKEAPESAERNGLLALIYHEGIGVEPNLYKSFEYAEKAVLEGGDPLGCYLLGYMCDNAETPDQKEGGPEQKYDQYDAERFYEMCSKKESKWKIPACNWLGDYFMNSARGGDPEIGIEYYEMIANRDAEASGKLSDYYWDLVMPDYTTDEYWTLPLFKWTKTAAKLDPEEYVYRLGWLYADGIGCRQSFWLALKYFSEAFFQGDWRGAYSIANMLEEKMNRNKDLTQEEKEDCREMISSLRKKADEMKEQEEREDYDNSQEED